MINSFIHFQDSTLEFSDIYSYGKGISPLLHSVAFSDIGNNLDESSNIYVMIPSQLFGFMKYENKEGLKGEVLRANVLIEVEDQLISDVSSLKFFYNAELNLASWIDSLIFESIAKRFYDMDAEVIFIPEHFLLQAHRNTIFLSNNSFVISFSDGSGFGGSISSLPDYLDRLESSSFDLKSIEVLKENNNISFNALKDMAPVQKSFNEIHSGLAAHLNARSLNLFKRKLSLQFLRSKFKLSYSESWIMAASLSLILLAPLLINSFLNTSIASYKQNTMTIFQQLNPGFKRLVNPKAQIDDLTKGVPLQSIVSSQDLEALGYVETLSDESILNIMINFDDREIKTNVENLSPLKLSLFEELIKSKSANVDTSGLNKGSDGWYGSLVIFYDAE